MATIPRFYTDVHLSTVAVEQLRQKGVDIIHCTEDGFHDEADERLLEHATQQKRVMVSCDSDFERHHAEYQTFGKQHGGIVYFRMPEQCKAIGLIVREILLLHEAADYETDLYNQLWRVKS